MSLQRQYPINGVIQWFENNSRLSFGTFGRQNTISIETTLKNGSEVKQSQLPRLQLILEVYYAGDPLPPGDNFSDLVDDIKQVQLESKTLNSTIGNVFGKVEVFVKSHASGNDSNNVWHYSAGENKTSQFGANDPKVYMCVNCISYEPDGQNPVDLREPLHTALMKFFSGRITLEAFKNQEVIVIRPQSKVVFPAFSVPPKPPRNSFSRNVSSMSTSSSISRTVTDCEEEVLE